MIRIGITGHPDFPIDEWRRQTIDLGELFQIPHNITHQEIEFARCLMDTFQLAQDDDETLLEILSKPSGFMSFLISVKRIVEEHQNNLSSDR
jgi:hypothetical protein